MQLPNTKHIDVRLLGGVYNNTVATYKFYWMLSLLEIVVRQKHKPFISIWEIVVGMVAEAWYPVHYFKLSFGKSDSLYEQIMRLQQLLAIQIDADKGVIKEQLLSKINEPEVRRALQVFTLNVPYRFLSPWIKYTNDAEVIQRSLSFENDCLYAIQDASIILNPKWEEYLIVHYGLLKDFTLWNLTLFLQKRNPNVPNIANKLVKPTMRDTLTRQRKCWNDYLVATSPFHCIYTGKVLDVGSYDLDHFIPWSFVSHNLMWNLLPIDSSINSSKSNHLPDLERYLPSFAQVHQQFLKTVYAKNPSNKLFEDYLTLHSSVRELIDLSEPDFLKLYYKTMSPISQIAENMGFKQWQNQ